MHVKKIIYFNFILIDFYTKLYIGLLLIWKHIILKLENKTIILENQ